MTYEQAEIVVGGLSHPSKMPCPSWGIPVKHCITGSKLAKIKDSVCSMCYAAKGFYVITNVKAAQARRYRKLKLAIMDSTARDKFVRAFCILTRDLPYFRWFDSGDLQSFMHLKMLNTIASGSPNCKFWLPTQEIGFVRRLLKDPWSPVAPNLNIRISSQRIGQHHKEIDKVHSVTWSTVTESLQLKDTLACPAEFLHAGTKLSCRKCRACWSKNVREVNYKLH